MYAPYYYCNCRSKFKWKPKTKLRKYLAEKCGWSVANGEKFTINSFIYLLLVHLYRHQLISDNGLIECRELLGILWPQGAPLRDHFHRIRDAIVLHLIGYTKYKRSLYCFRDKIEDLEVMNVPFMFMCLGGWDEIPERIGMTSRQLRDFIELGKLDPRYIPSNEQL